MSTSTIATVVSTAGLLCLTATLISGGYERVFPGHAEEPLRQETASLRAGTPEPNGGLIFAGLCLACHRVNGEGLHGQYPPLAGSGWLLDDPETPVRIVLRGLYGPITVNGKVYNNTMPHFFDKLSDEEIAAVVSHARASWGNNAPPVTPAKVDSLRRQTIGRRPWTAEELQRLRMPRPVRTK